VNPLGDSKSAARRRLVETIEESIPALEARVRQRAVHAVADRVLTDLGVGPIPRPALLAAIARFVDASVGELARVRATEASLGMAYQSASSPEEKRALLAEQLRRWAEARGRAARVPAWGALQARWVLRGDVKALKRSLDYEAIQERFAKQVADIVDDIEVAYHAFAYQARSIEDARDAVRAAVDGSVLRVALEHADPAQPAAVRRVALLAAGALVERIPARERLGHLGPHSARSVLAWARGISAGRWVQVAALELAILVFADRAVALIGERLRDRSPENEDGLIIRRNALRLLGSVPPESTAAGKAPALRVVSPPSEPPDSGARPTRAPARTTPPSAAPPTPLPPSALEVTPPPVGVSISVPPSSAEVPTPPVRSMRREKKGKKSGLEGQPSDPAVTQVEASAPPVEASAPSPPAPAPAPAPPALASVPAPAPAPPALASVPAPAPEPAAQDGAPEHEPVFSSEVSQLVELPGQPPPPTDPVDVAWIARDDPSEHVRQELCRRLAAFGRDDSFEKLISLAIEDKSPRVRGQALRELARAAMRSPGALPHAERGVRLALEKPGPPVAARVAFEAVRLLSTGPFAQLPPSTFVKDLEGFANRPESKPDLADEAAGILRLIEVESRPIADRIRHKLVAALDTLLEGESRPVELPHDAETRDIERALAVASRGDMTASLRRVGSGRYILTRGEPRGFRFWRAIHELRTPMPDKRKGWVHTAGRLPAGEIIAPPVGMAEVTPTRVPGERHVHPEVGGWGAFLPRIDDLLAVSRLKRGELRLITAGGSITLRGPETLRQRLRAWWRISLSYERTAQARSRSLMATEPVEQRRFATMMSEMGFSVAYGDSEGEVRGARYRIEPLLPIKYLNTESFVKETSGSALSAPVLPLWIDSFISYLVSPNGNTPIHLAWVVWGILAFIVLRNAYVMTTIERARYGIPLSVGGWGTRGKSGSERLKAALFHALRYDVVVKTTGCEAMFIHAMRDLPAGEIFIYRPYDKATIWEQRNILVTGRNLNCQVFLWECMALQPLFVDTLCAEWMQDEITTLTNAYPDHEDIQGPGGEDVARVISRFMPNEGLSFTTEEQMLPLLKDTAKRKNTNLVSVPPIESDLLAVDLLDRLPYQEHPRNVALILALADHFGIDPEWALVEIADHVILDLGVLKTYPTVSYRGRKLTFSNGMSANERAGFMSNWVRLAYDKHDPDDPPGRATVMLINNRADRVARSRVFAQIVVEDIGIDHVILINSNLGGMLQFITEGLDLKLKDLLITGDGGKERALERFDLNMKKVGIPARAGAFEDDLKRMLCALPMDEAKAAEIVASVAPKRADHQAVGAAVKAALDSMSPPEGQDDIRPDIVLHAERRARRMNVRDKTRADVIAALDRGDEAGANQMFRAAYRELFLERVEILWNVDAKGDKVIDFLTRAVPPGMDARVMGSQNIKGTGLDFVYRWLAIDRTRGALERMQKNPASRREVLNFLMSYSDIGLIDCREGIAALKAIQAANDPAWAEHKGLMDGALKRLEALNRDKTAALDAVAKAGMSKKILGRLEQLVDHMDSVRRTNRARVVMNDLYAQRIGHGQAAVLLREIVGRTKGGWLYKDVTEWQEKWAGRWAKWRPKRQQAPKSPPAAAEGTAGA